MPSSTGRTDQTEGNVAIEDTPRYKLPVAPLISRNLSYVLNPQNLPDLPLAFLRNDCLTRSLPFSSGDEGSVELLPIRSAEELQDTIRRQIPLESPQWDATVELMQALALVVASPAEKESSTASGVNSDNIRDRILLAACYAALHQLPKARSVLEAAREESRAQWTRDRKANNAQQASLSTDNTRPLLLALANVAALQRNQDADAKRFLRWYAKHGS